MREVIIETEVQNQLADLKAYLIGIQGEKKGVDTFKAIVDALDNLKTYDVGSNIKENAHFTTKRDEKDE